MWQIFAKSNITTSSSAHGKILSKNLEQNTPRIMSRTKGAKRKRIAQVDIPNKLSKPVARTLPSPDSLAGSEPRSLSTLVSDEELEITVDTLITLADNPSVIKSKACKELRAAVYDFRQACTTGVNTAGLFSHEEIFLRIC
jgi:hypothetical protein